MAYKREDIFDDEITSRIAEHVEAVLELLGEDPHREGLTKTPERVARSLQYLTKGYAQDGSSVLKEALFEEHYSEMVLIRDIDIFSLCEHHLLPFIGKCHIAYIPDGKIVGLSKIARLVEVYARRLQVQERLSVEIASCLQEALGAKGVAVSLEAMHCCMVMRGVEKPGTMTSTFAYTGVFESSAELRREFLQAMQR